MIKIENISVVGLEPAIRGMRNPMNSWDRSDSGQCRGRSHFCKSPLCDVEKKVIDCDKCSLSGVCTNDDYREFQLGNNDHQLMMKLASAGSVHGKFRRMINVYVDITAPLYWWKEFDTYKVGTVTNSCSTMHKIHERAFTFDDFSHEHLFDYDDLFWGDVIPMAVLESIVHALNKYREMYLESKDKTYWWQMIQILPSSYNQRRTVMMNYEVLSNIYQYRRAHKLDEWREFCQWIETLPYSEIITCNAQGGTVYGEK